MEAHEALERFEKVHEQEEEHEHGGGATGGLARQAALMVAVVAAFLIDQSTPNPQASHQSGVG
jgi:hypothetical protein